MRRRRLLTLTATALSVPVGGCADSGPDGSEPTATGTDAAPGTTTPAATGRDEPTASDPATSTGTEAAPTVTETPTTAWPAGPYADYDTTRVRVESPDGDHRGTVTAAVASTSDQRYLGLSDATSMPEDGGMVFVYDSVADRTFVMRRMDFGLDIVYADDTGTITTIHHAPKPGPDENGNRQRYPGRGQYVMEVNFEWTERHGVEVGDVLRFDP